MNAFFYEIMNKLSIGIVLLDPDKKIVFWNQWMEAKTDLKQENVYSLTLEAVAPKFLRPKYNKIVDLVITTGQARFLSGAVHGAFFENIEEKPSDDTPVKVRQNLQIERIENDFILIQIEDLTDHYQKVNKMKTFIQHLERENDEIRINEEKSRQMAMHDVLTGLPNRLFLMNKLKKRLEEHKIEKVETVMAIFFIDLDNLKAVNDQYGHKTGDAILREMSKRLKNALRITDTVARLSGDEFIIFVEGLADKMDVAKVAEHIIKQFKEPFETDNQTHQITCSMGISLYPQDGDDADTLIDHADQALYRVKNASKNDYAFFSQ